MASVASRSASSHWPRWKSDSARLWVRYRPKALGLEPARRGDSGPLSRRPGRLFEAAEQVEDVGQVEQGAHRGREVAVGDGQGEALPQQRKALLGRAHVHTRRA